MGKKKANVLTGSESVDDWLNSSHRLPEHIEAGKENPGSGGTGLGIAAVSELSHPTAVPAEANQLTPLPLPVEAGLDCGWSRGSREKARLTRQCHLRPVTRTDWPTLPPRNWAQEL